jgi:multidrug efflux pump subunit AcrB
MMFLVRVALQHPYTFVVMALLIAALGLGSIATIPTDIFPAINIPVVSVIWMYNGIAPGDMANRIVTICERAMTTTVQTNIVRQDGKRGALLTVLKNGSTSTLTIVSNVKKRLPLILAGPPKTLHIKPLFDQSIFAGAAVNVVVREATIAAGLTGVMTLLFLGSVRRTIGAVSCDFQKSRT